jgi:hypothetical protein
MHVDGADQRRIGQAEIDRPAHRIDIPVIKPGILCAARAEREPKPKPKRSAQEHGEDRG